MGLLELEALFMNFEIFPIIAQVGFTASGVALLASGSVLIGAILIIFGFLYNNKD